MGRVRYLLLASVLLAAGLWSPPGLGGTAAASHLTGQWSAHGPSGGRAFPLEIGPDGTVYAGTGGAGVFASRDGGLSWQRRSAGLPTDVGPTGIAVSRSSASRVYLSTLEHGAYRSDDAGVSWRRIHIGLTVMDVAVDPTDPDTVYLGDAGGVNYKSTDGGTTWTEMTIPTHRFPIWDLEIAPSDPDVLYATDGQLLMRSEDAGATWHGTNGYTTNVHDISVHPTDPLTVYVATTFDMVQKSTDGGRTWTTGTGLPDLYAYTVEIDRSQPTTVYAGTARGGYAYRSVDAGATWQPHRVADATGAVGHIASGPAGVVYAGLAYHGVFRSADQGVSWTLRSTGLVGSDVRALVSVPSSPSTVYAGTYGDGVHRTTDGGRTWHRRGLVGRIVNDLSVHPSSPRTVYAATDRGVYRTTDAGLSWRRITSGVAGAGAHGVAVAPSNASVVYTVNWMGVSKSVDAGRTWQQLNVPPNAMYWSVAVHPTRSGTAWVGGQVLNYTVLRTTDGGRTWRSSLACPMHSGPRDLTVDTRQPSVLYAGCETYGVYRSLDSGVTWRRVTPNAIRTVTEIVVDPADSRRLYAGTYTGSGVSGVYRSIDRGLTWTRFSTGMTTTWTHSLAITSTSSTLHAGTTGYGLNGGGGGVFTYRLK
jgi:photosystem II stability/assembly factor-like uncharacterized protein